MSKDKLIAPLSNLKKRGRMLGMVGIAFFILLIIILALVVSGEDKKDANLADLNQKVLREEEITQNIKDSNDKISQEIDSLIENLDLLDGNN